MKMLLAAATLALTLAAGGLTAHAQGPFQQPPGPRPYGREFGPGPGYFPDGPGAWGEHRRYRGPVVIVPEPRRFAPPPAYYSPPPPPLRPAPPFGGLLRFIFER